MPEKNKPQSKMLFAYYWLLLLDTLVSLTVSQQNNLGQHHMDLAHLFGVNNCYIQFINCTFLKIGVSVGVAI